MTSSDVAVNAARNRPGAIGVDEDRRQRPLGTTVMVGRTRRRTSSRISLQPATASQSSQSSQIGRTKPATALRAAQAAPSPEGRTPECFPAALHPSLQSGRRVYANMGG